MKPILLCLALLLLVATPLPARTVKVPPAYAVVVSKKTAGDTNWSQVVAELVKKHHATVETFDADVNETLPDLRRLYPRYVCFVAQPEEATREFVAKVQRLTRQFNDDPYPDCFWGILTGYDADNALRIAREQTPLIIHKTAAATEVALDCCEQGKWFSEVKKNQAADKEPGHTPAALHGPDDTTQPIADLLTRYHADLFITSGHASEHNWQIGYTFRDGFFRCENGRLYGLDTAGARHPIESPNPKIYMPVGNCLMGHIDGKNSMAIAYMNSAGVDQMFGYTVETWYGYAGWGCLDYFVEQPGRYTFNEAFMANQVALIHRLATYFPELASADSDHPPAAEKIAVSAQARAAGLTAEDGLGLLYDRDTLAFYGDPAWEARMAKMELAWDQQLTGTNGVWTFELKPNRGTKTFDPINTNGSQRGGRPIIEYLPARIKTVEILEGAELNPVITENFILIPNPRECPTGRQYRVVFRQTQAN